MIFTPRSVLRTCGTRVHASTWCSWLKVSSSVSAYTCTCPRTFGQGHLQKTLDGRRSNSPLFLAINTTRTHCSSILKQTTNKHAVGTNYVIYEVYFMICTYKYICSFVRTATYDIYIPVPFLFLLSRDVPA